MMFRWLTGDLKLEGVYVFFVRLCSTSSLVILHVSVGGLLVGMFAGIFVDVAVVVGIVVSVVVGGVEVLLKR